MLVKWIYTRRQTNLPYTLHLMCTVYTVSFFTQLFPHLLLSLPLFLPSSLAHSLSPSSSLPLPSLHNVTELLLFDNMLESLPDSLFHMKSLEMFNVDRNHLMEIPDSVRL